MVKIAEVERLIALEGKSAPSGRICVMMGATSGIGAATLDQLAVTLKSPVFYVIGRSETRFESQRKRLAELNPAATINFLQAEISLLKDVDNVCDQLVAKERSIDLLYMSAGLIKFKGPHYTAEGIDTCFSLSYYARMRLMMRLAPLLQDWGGGRVLSVLNGGEERRIATDDLGLEKSYSMIKVVGHTTTMTTLCFEELAKKYSAVSFLHAYPGWVKTDIVSELFATKKTTWYSPFLVLLRALVTVLLAIGGIEPEECGKRQVYHALSPAFPSPMEYFEIQKQGLDIKPEPWSTMGVYRVGWLSEVECSDKVLGLYRKQGLPAQILEHTEQVFQKALKPLQ